MGGGFPLTHTEAEAPSLPRTGLLQSSEVAIALSRRVTLAAVTKQFYPSQPSPNPRRAGSIVPSSGGQS